MVTRATTTSAMAVALGLVACTGSPSPLAPGLRGSVGLPHHGVLTHGEPLPAKGEGFVRFRDDGIHYGSPRLLGALEAASRYVAEQRPGSPPLVIADLSARYGGETERHRSHRTGRDVDLLLFLTTTDGRPVRSPGFIAFGKDGLAPARIAGRQTYVRFDTERTWLLVKGLLQSGEAEVQWLFIARWLEAMLIEYAIARGEDLDLILRAEAVLHQPGDSAPHADHIHARIACTPEEEVAGCGGGPRWKWLPPPLQTVETDEDLLYAILEDLVPPP